MHEPTTGTALMFGLALRHLRTQAGLSQRELGRKSLYDHSRISRAEQGDILVPIEQVRALDAALDAGGLLVALRQAADLRPVAPPMVPGDDDDEPVMLEVLTADGKKVTVSISRRRFGHMLAGGTIASILPGTVDPAQTQRLTQALERPARLDDEIIGYFRRVLAEHYTADKMLGPAGLLQPVLAQIGVLDDLRKGARARQIEPLMQVLSQYAEMAGWLYQDLGELNTALHWSRRAAEWAQCAGDRQMAAYMLIRQSNITGLTDDHAAVVQLASAARRDPAGLDPKLTALAAQQQARGLAMLGEHDECYRLLDEAAETLRDHPQVTEPDAPVYLHHYDLDTLDEQSAFCHRVTGRADTAAAILESKIDRLPASFNRDRGHLTAKLAVAVAQSPHPDLARAAHLGREALTIARQTGSARIRRELDVLNAELLHRGPGTPDTRTFHEALLAETKTPGQRTPGV
ncbi:transcriptional regulator [Sphaerisporangium melleum]|uniref:Transcriptional regulator n=1 Tax=Sphaerisporangium melleum TaxID=321316 RepID=A0A917VEH6_9ACTN|nr:helix-turn-helix transcriptional regulator [Sphaerisporangium melleum]GGK70528.1 transcriptional regulator [Sphaerisporangium melleum]GII70279.1 transcriptional regulator [Sphaerisporangium melleum]